MIYRNPPKCDNCGMEIEGIYDRQPEGFCGDTFIMWDWTGHICPDREVKNNIPLTDQLEKIYDVPFEMEWSGIGSAYYQDHLIITMLSGEDIEFEFGITANEIQNLGAGEDDPGDTAQIIFNNICTKIDKELRKEKYENK